MASAYPRECGDARDPGGSAGYPPGTTSHGAGEPSAGCVDDSASCQVTMPDDSLPGGEGQLAVSPCASIDPKAGKSGRLGSTRGVRFGEVVDNSSGRNGQPDREARKPTLGSSSKPSASSPSPLEVFSEALAEDREKLIVEALSEIQKACLVAVPQGEQNLLPIGAYHFGVLQPGEVVDVLFAMSPGGASVASATDSIHQQLQACSSTGIVSPVSDGGPLKAPGFRIAMHSGVIVNLLIAQRIEGLPDPTPESVVPQVAGLYAHEISERILASVPNRSLFRSLLRFVRRWARERGVYGDNGFMGFLGGTAWAVCCVRVCQASGPQTELPQLVGQFFRTTSRWDWRHPVSIPMPRAATQKPATDGNASGGDRQPLPAAAQQQEQASVSALREQAKPASNGDRCPGSAQQEQHAAVAAPGEQAGGDFLTLVLLPVGQGISATPFARDTILKITQKELRRGYKMVQQVQQSRAPWPDVYAQARFFQRHRHYLQFDFMARSPEVLEPWLAWSRQQLQNLVRLFEEKSASVVTLRPWPVEIEFEDSTWTCARAVFVGLHLERGDEAGGGDPRRSFDLREPIVKLLEAVSEWGEVEAMRGRFELLIRHVRLADLEQWLENQFQGKSPPALAAEATGRIAQGR